MHIPGKTSNAGAGFLPALLIVLGVAAGFSLQTLNDYDIWWHLHAGRWMVDNLAVPRSDTFSFSTAGADWTFVYWLSDPLFYLVQEAAGIDGLLIFKVLIIAAAAAGLFLFAVRLGVPWAGAAAVVVWVIYLARFRFTLRPLIFKFAGVVFLFWFFYVGTRSRFRYAIFFAAVLLWNGLYPAAFLAQVFALFLLVEKALEHLTRSARYAPGDLRDAFVLLLLASLALLVNPHGLDLYRQVYGSMFADYAAGANFVEEHQPLVWSAHLSFASLAVLAGASFWFGRRNFRLLTPMVYIAFLVLAAGSVRYVGMASFAMAGVLFANMQGFAFALPQWSRRIPGRSFVALAALAIGSLLLWALTFSKGKVFEFGLGVNQSRYPFAALQRLEALPFVGNIYNSWKFGGFLQWHLPAARTFIDGRCLPAQLDLFARFQEITPPQFARYLAENDVRAALLDRQDTRDISLFNMLPNFRLVHADDLSLLFLRNDVGPVGGGDSPPVFRYLQLGGYDYGYLVPLAKGPQAAEVEAEIRAALRASPENFYENFLLGFFYEVREDPRAAAQYLRAARRNPAFAFTHFQLGERGGLAALRAGEWSLAAELASLALEYQKNGQLYQILGVARQKLGDHVGAEQSYLAALSILESGQVRNNLGFLSLETREFAKALDAFGITLAGRDKLSREQAHYGRILSLREMGRNEEAAESLRQFAGEFPDSSYLAKLRQN